MAKLPWDCVLSAELARCYKPDPRVYQMAADLLCLPCDRVLMVAAHSFDLRGAPAAGLRTALVGRQAERIIVQRLPDISVALSEVW